MFAGDAKGAGAAIVALVGIAAEEGPGREGGEWAVKTLLVDWVSGDLEVFTIFLCIFNT